MCLYLLDGTEGSSSAAPEPEATAVALNNIGCYVLCSFSIQSGRPLSATRKSSGLSRAGLTGTGRLDAVRRTYQSPRAPSKLNDLPNPRSTLPDGSVWYTSGLYPSGAASSQSGQPVRPKSASPPSESPTEQDPAENDRAKPSSPPARTPPPRTPPPRTPEPPPLAGAVAAKQPGALPGSLERQPWRRVLDRLVPRRVFLSQKVFLSAWQATAPRPAPRTQRAGHGRRGPHARARR